MRCQTNKLLKSEEKKEVIFFDHSSTLKRTKNCQLSRQTSAFMEYVPIQNVSRTVASLQNECSSVSGFGLTLPHKVVFTVFNCGKHLCCYKHLSNKNLNRIQSETMVSFHGEMP